MTAQPTNSPPDLPDTNTAASTTMTNNHRHPPHISSQQDLIEEMTRKEILRQLSLAWMAQRRLARSCVDFCLTDDDDDDNNNEKDIGIEEENVDREERREQKILARRESEEEKKNESLIDMEIDKEDEQNQETTTEASEAAAEEGKAEEKEESVADQKMTENSGEEEKKDKEEDLSPPPPSSAAAAEATPEVPANEADTDAAQNKDANTKPTTTTNSEKTPPILAVPTATTELAKDIEKKAEEQEQKPQTNEEQQQKEQKDADQKSKEAPSPPPAQAEAPQSLPTAITEAYSSSNNPSATKMATASTTTAENVQKEDVLMQESISNDCGEDKKQPSDGNNIIV